MHDRLVTGVPVKDQARSMIIPHFRAFSVRADRGRIRGLRIEARKRNQHVVVACLRMIGINQPVWCSSKGIDIRSDSIQVILRGGWGSQPFFNGKLNLGEVR
jgi:hypothetical protein